MEPDVWGVLEDFPLKGTPCQALCELVGGYLGPPVVPFSHPFVGWEGFLLKQTSGSLILTSLLEDLAEAAHPLAIPDFSQILFAGFNPEALRLGCQKLTKRCSWNRREAPGTHGSQLRHKCT